MGGLSEEERREFAALTGQLSHLGHAKRRSAFSRRWFRLRWAWYLLRTGDLGRSAPTTRRQRRSRRRHSNGVYLTAVGAVAVFLLAVLTQTDLFDSDQRRLRPAVAAAQGAGEYRLNGSGVGGIARWSPCEPIRMVTNFDGSPPGAAKALDDAINEVSSVSGLEFVIEGETTERPRRYVRVPASVTVKHKAVLIVWSNSREDRELRGRVAGYAQPGVESRVGSPRIVTGQVVLDTEALPTPKWGSNPYQREWRLIIMHELGHLVGLDHVNDTGELMHPTSTTQTGWGPGDLRGLAEAGNGPC